MTLMDDIDAGMRAREKLKEAAKKGEGVTLTACEAEQLDKHLSWLAEERDSLIDSGAFDDD